MSKKLHTHINMIC